MAPQATADPYASIATPLPAANTAASTDDPYASIATPIPPAPGLLSRAAGVAGDVATGFGAGAVDTISGIGHLLNKVPVVGETLAPSAGLASLDKQNATDPNNTAQNVGKGLEGIAEFYAGNAALDGLAHGAKLVQMAKKYPLIAQTLDMATAHPWLAKILTESAKGAVTGGAEGAVKGAQQGNATGGAAQGAAAGGATGAVVGAVSGLRVNPFRGILKSPEAVGEAAAQPIAQAGVRTAAPPVGASLRSGIDIQTPLAASKALYQTVDDAANTDFKALYDKLDAAHDAAREAGIGSPEEAKAQLNIKNTQDAIDDAKKVAAQSGVPNVDKILSQADAKFAETQANKDLNSKFFGNVIEGNVKHGAPETINVDKAINVLEQMDKPNKYGLSRLQQTSLGPKGAFELKQALYDAQKAGQKALDARVLRNAIAKWALGGGGVLGGASVTYEALKH